MFEILPNPSLATVLLVARAGLLIGAFWVFALAFIRWRRTDERQVQQLHAQLQRTFAEVRSLHETVSVMSARLESLSERSATDSRLAPASATSAQRGYDLAARLAKNGSSVEELIATCGITRHEAELLVRLHTCSTDSTAAAAWQMRATATTEKQPAQTAQQQAAARKRGSLLSVVG